MYSDMGSKLANLCDRLHCDECGKDMEVSAKKISSYIANGWPMCCGFTMRLITKAEAVKGK